MAYHFEFGHLRLSGAKASLGAKCSSGSPSSQTPYLLPYTGWVNVDGGLCTLVTLFMETLNTEQGLSDLDYLFGTTGIIVLLPFAESVRRHSNNHGSPSLLIAFPALWLLITQVASIGMTFPVYWLVYIASGNVQTRQSFALSPPNLSQALSLVFAVLGGAMLPSSALKGFRDPYITVIWQFYPVFMSVAYFLHYLLTPRAWRSQSGLVILRFLFIGVLIISSSSHIAAVWPAVLEGDFAQARSMVLPSLTPLPVEAELSAKLANFLRWDGLFAFFASAIATLWFVKNSRELASFVVWYLISVPLFGFGAAITAVIVWVENLI